MHILLLVLLTFSLPVWSQTYDERLEYIEEMAGFFPGFVNNSYKGRTLGALGGIYVQTEWQQRTGRSDIPAWAHINKHLTVKPYKYFLDYLKEGPSACTNQECIAWMDYFQNTDVRVHGLFATRSKKFTANKLLWRAHEESIKSALNEEPDLFDKMTTPANERNYLKGWVSFVHVLATSRMPTSEFLVRILAKPTSPHCSPLGTPDCDLRHLSPASRIFVSELIKLGAR